MTILWALWSARLCWTILPTHNNMEHKTVGDRLSDAEAKALTVALAATPTEVEAMTFADTMGDAEDEKEVHRLAVPLLEVVAKTVAIYYAMSRPIEWSMTS